MDDEEGLAELVAQRQSRHCYARAISTELSKGEEIPVLKTKPRRPSGREEKDGDRKVSVEEGTLTEQCKTAIKCARYHMSIPCV